MTALEYVTVANALTVAILLPIAVIAMLSVVKLVRVVVGKAWRNCKRVDWSCDNPGIDVLGDGGRRLD